MSDFQLPKTERAPRNSGLIFRQRLYFVWANMLRRCCDPGNHAFPRYGGRGIRVWSQFSDFNCFYRWSISNGYKPGLQLDRRNNDGDYSPWNCRWVSCVINAQNRANNVRLPDGRAASAVCRDAGIPLATFHWRRHQGWSLEQACGLLPAPDEKGAILLPDGRRAVAVAKENGIARNTFYGRIDRGWSPEAASSPINDGRLRLSNGMFVSDAARLAGLPRDLPYKRIASGWSPDDAVSVPSGGKRPLPQTVAK